MPSNRPLIALISAVAAAIPPARLAFDELFPAATVWNLLDDRLLTDAAENGTVTAGLAARMNRLIEHAILEGSDAVLLTCSLYSPVAHRVAATVDIPILGPDDALFDAAAQAGYRRLAVVSSAADPLADSLARIRQVLDPEVVVTGVIADAGAVDRGDLTGLAHSVGQAVAGLDCATEAVVLGQYSLAASAAAVQDATGLPTLAGPQFAVRSLRALTTGGAA
ncbi:putative NBD/HSP70 family sugar kinase [Mycobacterium sp. OAS707]|uniref:aspartate/glutamate racemase family protein n=1 Tax=Mycobacterium sp. OAS707 TaxID=2663822 RepID=UPI00178AADAE|nr:aspartate/glutamate racemase family protein [Mycobacterium sp. OAS707]MBE1551731.1 putative NBD/HSP70 family sugar kinase [Mycobacterium sp. OAS707]